MKKTIDTMKRPVPMAVAILAVAILAAAGPASSAKAPAGKTYFVVSLGLAPEAAEAYLPGAGCLQFTRAEICEVNGDCGDWWRIEEESLNRRFALGFELELIDDATGLPIRIEGRGRVDSRGPKSSIAAVAHALEETSGVSINFAIAGRAVGLARCRQLVADFAAAWQ